jgi:hypothetical protein
MGPHSTNRSSASALRLASDPGFVAGGNVNALVRCGYRLVASEGGVFSFGFGQVLGLMGGALLNAPIT